MNWYVRTAGRADSIDWSKVEERLREGASLTQIGREMGVPGRSDMLDRLFRKRISDPAHPLRLLAKENALRARASHPVHQSPETKDRRRRQWTPEKRRERSEQLKDMWTQPEYQADMANARTQTWTQPEYRAKMQELRSKQWEDPAFRARMQAVREDPQWKEYWLERRRANPPASNTDFWGWLAAFPEDKQQQILKAIRMKRNEATQTLAPQAPSSPPPPSTGQAQPSLMPTAKTYIR